MIDERNGARTAGQRHVTGRLMEFASSEWGRIRKKWSLWRIISPVRAA